MENLIIIGILAAVILVGVISAANHFRGKGSCCGGGSTVKLRRKKLRKVIATKTFQVGGMHCEKCSSRVMEVVNDLDHVSGVVNLKKGLLTVSYEEEVPDGKIIAAIERVGYTVHVK